MNIPRLCYNNIKKKRAQILLALFFLSAFAICFYIAIQQPRKIVIYIDDVSRISKEKSKVLFLEANTVEDFSFENHDQDAVTKNKVEIFGYDIDNLEATKSSHMKHEIDILNHEDNQFKNKIEYTAEETTFISSQEGYQGSQDENNTFSLQGFLNLHVWENVCHFQLESLREFILFPQAPSKRRLLNSSSIFVEKGNNFGERMFGFISPSTSGEYQFAISSSGNSELWLSSDETSANLRRIAFLGSREKAARSEPENYYTVPSQVSTTFYLTKNMKYLIDVLHKHQLGKVHLEVAWRFAGQEKFSVIASKYLWAEMNDSHVADNAVRLDDYGEQRQRSRDSVPPSLNSEEVKDVLPECPYEPSYLVKHQLIRFQVRSKLELIFLLSPTASVHPHSEASTG